MNAQLTPKAAFQGTLPTVFGYLGIGIAFGVVGQAAGLSTLEILLMSLLTYGGSVQFVIISMLLGHSALLPMLLSTFLINSRMILMSMTIAPYFKNESLFKNLWIGSLLTDETFALGMNKTNSTAGQLNFAWFNTSNLIAYFAWAVASLLGAFLGNFVASPQELGLDFALVAMFIGLLYLQIISDQVLQVSLQLAVVTFVLVLTYLGLIFIPANILILVITLLGCGFGVIIKHAFF
ncbi:AzlC family ABC transporter permease [Liquorilactobacillus satsumensis]|uniref:AzlC family ABC transporter permease n=1 Tax=Liquorilactobacillus satsumensis TaxID=259059 RepID=UPI0039ECDAF5